MVDKHNFIMSLKNTNREGIEKVIEYLEKTDFFIAPASTQFHGNYEGGLMEHSMNVYKCMKNITRLPIVPKEYDESTLVIVCLLHDICKCNNYEKYWRNVKNEDTGKWEKKECYRTNTKTPLGHGSKSVILLQQLGLKLTMDEIMAINWHMGAFDLSEYEKWNLSQAMEEYPLVLMLQQADLMASYWLEERNE